MTEPKVWATSEDGSIEYVSINKDILQSSIEAMQQSFYFNENVCVAFGMPNEPESFSEMDKLLFRAAKDGVSIAAIEKATGIIAGAAFNKIESPDEANFYPNFIQSCQRSASKGVAQWMSDIANMFDIHQHCNVTSVLEIMFLGVKPEFRKRGIAKKLFEVSVDVAKNLKEGRNVKVPVDDGGLLEFGDPPEIVSGIFTSFITQKIASDLGFAPGIRINFDKFVYNGESLESKINGDTKYLTYEYLKL